MMHVCDVFPTLLRAAKVNVSVNRLKLDGIDQWNVIQQGGKAVRKEMVNFDDVLGFGAYIFSMYKLVNGSTANGDYDGWLASKTNEGNNNAFEYAMRVMSSKVGKSISSLNKTHLNFEKIKKLRRDSSISCSNSVEKVPCDLKKGPCLFDVYEDPCEENNLAAKRQALVKAMLSRYMKAKKSAVASRRKSYDPACDPINFRLNWQWWEKDS
jgi:arylsulfatase B